MRRTSALAGILLLAALPLVACGDDSSPKTTGPADLSAGSGASGAAGAAGASTPASGGQRRPLVIAHQGGDAERPSDTLYSFRQAVASGADWLDLDIGVTSDNQVVVLHDTTLDRTTNGTGNVSDTTLAAVQALDGAYWFCSDGTTGPGCATGSFPFRGAATGAEPAPGDSCPTDFRIPTLAEVLAAFPDVPATVEIKGRTPAETDAEYVQNAEVLAQLLEPLHRRGITVVSFHQPAVDRFHQLAPDYPVSPGITNGANWLLAGGSPGDGVTSFQVPIQYQGTPVTTAANVAKAHSQGYDWFTWLDADTEETPEVWKALLDECVDGVDTAKPTGLTKLRDDWVAAGGRDRCAGQWARPIVAAPLPPPADAAEPHCQ